MGTVPNPAAVPSVTYVSQHSAPIVVASCPAAPAPIVTSASCTAAPAPVSPVGSAPIVTLPLATQPSCDLPQAAVCEVSVGPPPDVFGNALSVNRPMTVTGVPMHTLQPSPCSP